MSVCGGLRDKVIGDRRLVRTDVRQTGLWAESVCCKVVLEYSHTHLFLYDCFHITLAKLNTTETAGPIQKKFADL